MARIVFLDEFDGPAGSSLASHTPDIGTYIVGGSFLLNGDGTVRTTWQADPPFIYITEALTYPVSASIKMAATVAQLSAEMTYNGITLETVPDGYGNVATVGFDHPSNGRSVYAYVQCGYNKVYARLIYTSASGFGKSAVHEIALTSEVAVVLDGTAAGLYVDGVLIDTCADYGEVGSACLPNIGAAANYGWDIAQFKLTDGPLEPPPPPPPPPPFWTDFVASLEAP